ncbi:MAG: Asp-tRNA(Asn)/Glu-tRNA(Gln) amidotransferase subunit GatC [Candidatus Diapherotrites archaeon]|nr:Asp-tRNA(Asn)/Glu-tRNA(Gln) amidotransferase subunit GatC [Candidatus Diapherotrites archaeon]
MEKETTPGGKEKPPVDRELLLRVAANARLNLREEEIKKFLPQLQEILTAFGKLDELDVSAEKPSFQPLRLENVSRQDSAGKCLSQEDALRNTKHKKDGYFLGPKVV